MFNIAIPYNPGLYPFAVEKALVFGVPLNGDEEELNEIPLPEFQSHCVLDEFPDCVPNCG